MIKRMAVMLLAMALLVGGIVGYKLYGRHMMNQGMAGQRPPPVVVSAAPAGATTWQPRLHAVGSFAAIQGIVVSAQLDGVVTRLGFESDSLVAAGELLVQQDVSTERAQLASAEAGATLARLALERATQLRAQGSGPQADLDAAVAAAQQADAAVAAIRATIDKKTIRAPFTGRLGLREVSLGQFLRSGAAIVPLHAPDPIYFNFSLPQQHAGRVARGLRVDVTVDAFPGEVFRGEVTALNAGVNDATRNLEIQATLPNPDGRLQSAMFGTALLQLAATEPVVVVPVTALVYNPYGDAVYIVEGAPAGGAGLVVRQQFVQAGEKRGDLVALSKGVAPGALVVTAGQLKLRNGSAVVLNNAVPAPAAADPAPAHP